MGRKKPKYKSLEDWTKEEIEARGLDWNKHLVRLDMWRRGKDPDADANVTTDVTGQTSGQESGWKYSRNPSDVRKKKTIEVRPHKRKLKDKTVKVKGHKKKVSKKKQKKKVEMNFRPIRMDETKVDADIIRTFDKEKPAWVKFGDSSKIYTNPKAMRKMYKEPMERARLEGGNKILNKYSDVIDSTPNFYDILSLNHEGVHPKRGDTNKPFVGKSDERTAELYALTNVLTKGNIKDANSLIDEYPSKSRFEIEEPTARRTIINRVKEMVDSGSEPKIDAKFDNIGAYKGKVYWTRKPKRKHRKDHLKGGLADKRNYEYFDKKELTKGTKVEMEHTNNKNIAKEIAGDHLAEHPEYYTYLEKMEAKLKRLKNGRTSKKK